MNTNNEKAVTKKVLIFDLDGTLYQLRGGSYAKSPLKRRVGENAEKFIAKKLSIEQSYAKCILNLVRDKYVEDISIGLEREFGIDRYEYFNAVWDIRAAEVIKMTHDLHEILRSLSQEYRLVLLSDAPRVWINNVLNHLKVTDIFGKNVFSGEGSRRKGFGTAFAAIIKRFRVAPEDCISIGDQEVTDIIPAKEAGMHTILIHPKDHQTRADLHVTSMRKLPRALKSLPK